MKHLDLQFFDKCRPCDVMDTRALPHWQQSGTLCFITWRISDSLPQERLRDLDAAIDGVLRADGLKREDLRNPQWLTRDIRFRSRIHWKLFLLRDKLLDRGFGRCRLRDPANSEIIGETLRHFDEARCFVTDFVVMPNHAHLIAAFADGDKMMAQCAAWKRFCARRINARENLSGEFWQVDQFDHLIRNEQQFRYFRRYIQKNPLKARLKPGEYLHWQKNLAM